MLLAIAYVNIAGSASLVDISLSDVPLEEAGSAAECFLHGPTGLLHVLFSNTTEKQEWMTLVRDSIQVRPS